MQARMTTVLAASLFASTAMVAPGFAQDIAACDQLRGIVDENEATLEQGWLDQAAEVIDVNDDAECTAWVEVAQTTLDQGDAAQMIEGRIVVRQPEPRVSVTQAAPEIDVMQPQPQVEVTQGQPEIIVRQARPTVRIQMPQPTVTIEQPAPEIIVRMPDPNISVSQAEPQVSVRQAQPTVTVEQGEAQVDVVGVDQPEEPSTAQVDVQQAQPVVELEQAEGQAQVDLQQAQPQVRYESAEPIVEIEGGGEPVVEFAETGEPNVQMAAAGDAADASGEDMEMAAGSEGLNPDTADTLENPVGMRAASGISEDMSWRGERTALTAPDAALDGYERVTDFAGMTTEDLEGAEVYGPEGDNIAPVESVVIDEGGAVQYFLMDVGGFLGLGVRTVAVGFDEVTILRNEAGLHRIEIGTTQQQLETMPEYDAM